MIKEADKFCRACRNKMPYSVCPAVEVTFNKDGTMKSCDAYLPKREGGTSGTTKERSSKSRVRRNGAGRV